MHGGAGDPTLSGATRPLCCNYWAAVCHNWHAPQQGIRVLPGRPKSNKWIINIKKKFLSTHPFLHHRNQQDFVSSALWELTAQRTTIPSPGCVSAPGQRVPPQPGHQPVESLTSASPVTNCSHRFILLLFYPIWFSHHPFDDPMDDLMASYARDIFWKPCLIHSLPISDYFWNRMVLLTSWSVPAALQKHQEFCIYSSIA